MIRRRIEMSTMWLALWQRVKSLFWGWRVMKGHEICSVIAATGSGSRAVVWGGMESSGSGGESLI